MLKVGILGCGNISGIYFKNLTTTFSKFVTVYACADLDEEKVKAAAKKYNIPHVMTLDQMLSCPEIDLILNLTTPGGHYPLSKKALEAGKHVYSEKPLALEYTQGKELLELAEKKGLYLGCAPDTFLGAGIQTCISEIEKGSIGVPTSATAFMMCHGHESWHPAPEFYYDIGGGPLFDMGPYYITALVRLLGKAKSVFAMGSKAFTERTITSQPKNGQKIPVKVDTHVAGLISFENGATASIIMSFDVWKHRLTNIEVHGTKGSIGVPDPNGFGGKVRLAKEFCQEFELIELISPYQENARGIGVAETDLAISEGRLNNASGYLALHVLEIMDAMTKSAASGEMITLESSPAPAIAMDWSVQEGELKTKS